MTYLVCGPPCGGKSTWVDQHFEDGDIVLDYDAIMAAVCRRPVHRHNEAAKQMVAAMFWAGLEYIAAELDRANSDSPNVWVIACASETARREAIARRLGAEIVLVDPGLDVCIERSRGRALPDTTIRRIRSWYAAAGLSAGCAA